MKTKSKTKKKLINQMKNCLNLKNKLEIRKKK